MSNPPTKPAPKALHPLPLSSTLHDLALLRASDLDFAALLPSKTSPNSPHTEGEDTGLDSAVEASVQRSIEFSREARAALKLLHSDAVEREGAKVEQVRGRLEDVMTGLEVHEQ